jgi:hypothetical protein
MEELAEQVYPAFAYHVQQILPCTVTYTRVKVDCDGDCILFQFGVRPTQHWPATVAERDRSIAHHG